MALINKAFNFPFSLTDSLKKLNELEHWRVVQFHLRCGDIMSDVRKREVKWRRRVRTNIHNSHNIISKDCLTYGKKNLHHFTLILFIELLFFTTQWNLFIARIKKCKKNILITKCNFYGRLRHRILMDVICEWNFFSTQLNLT